MIAFRRGLRKLSEEDFGTNCSQLNVSPATFGKCCVTAREKTDGIASRRAIFHLESTRISSRFDASRKSAWIMNWVEEAISDVQLRVIFRVIDTYRYGVSSYGQECVDRPVLDYGRPISRYRKRKNNFALRNALPLWFLRIGLCSSFHD